MDRMILLTIFLFVSCAEVLAAENSTDDAISNVRFFCMNSSDKVYKITSINDKDLSQKLDLKLGFAFYIHGWLAKFDSEKKDHISHKIGLEWVKAKKINFCGVDWRELAKDGYYDATVKHVKHVGTQLALFIQTLNDLKIKMDKIAIAGHSLGAHVAGFAGECIYKKLGTKISTIFDGFKNLCGHIMIFPDGENWTKARNKVESVFTEMEERGTLMVLKCKQDHG